jgi:protein-disulfide isomerase
MSSTAKKRRETNRETGRARRKVEQAQAARRRQFIFLGVVALVIAVAGVIASLALVDRGSSSNLPPIVAASTTVDSSIQQNGIALGDPAAKVTVTEWGDFQCPYCGDFARDVQPQLIADYVKTGKIKFEFKNLAFLGDESVKAAEAGACAVDQGKFWAFHDAIFANQAGENKGAFSSSRLEQIAAIAGLDLAQYKTCMANNAHKNDVSAAAAAGRAIPIQSTPSFVIDGKVILWSNYADLKTAIDAALAQAGA